MAEHINEQARIRMRDLILDGTGDGQANADAMSAIRAAHLVRFISNCFQLMLLLIRIRAAIKCLATNLIESITENSSGSSN